MNKEWVLDKKELINNKFEKMKEELCDYFKTNMKFILSQETINTIINYIESLKVESIFYYTDIAYKISLLILQDLNNNSAFICYKQFKEKVDELERIASLFKRIDVLVDSDTVSMEGDIVITDPCYTIQDKDWGNFCNKLFKGETFNYDAHPLPNGIVRDTIYGDWSCTTYNTDTKESIGEFCADAGLVCVDTLENVLKRKPNFLNEYGEYCRTIIPNFKGTIGIKVVQIRQDKKDDIDIWNYEVRVIGEGINTKTGEPINFFTTQTGL